MELGMIGLGRMGANMTQRLVRGGHRVVGFDFKPEARKRIEQYGAESVASLDALAAKLAAPRTLWMMVPSGDATEATVKALLPLLAGGRHRHRRRQFKLQRHAATRSALRRQAIELRRLRHQRRRVGTDRGLQHDDRRRSVGRRTAAADLRDTGAGAKSRLGSRRSERRGPLHEDDSQRHRVRFDAGVCRRLFDHAAQDGIRTRPAPGGRDLARRKRRAFVAARFDGDRAEREPALWMASHRLFPTRAKDDGRLPKRSI